MMSSLRMRLLAGTGWGMVLLLACFSLIVYTTIRRTLLNEFDRSLVSMAEVLTTGIEGDANGIDMDSEVRQMPQFNDPEQPVLYEVWAAEGGVLIRSRLLGTGDLPRLASVRGACIPRAIRDPRNGRPLRAVGIEFLPRIDDEQAGAQARIPPERPLMMVVARDASTLLARLNSLRWLLLATASGTTGLALFVGVVVVCRGLRPLQAIAAEIAAVDETSLDAHIGSESAPAEIVPIQDRLNSLLVRLREALDRERRFSANVAHELRNPLAGMRSTVEVTLTRQRDGAEYRDSLSECLGIVDGMQAMVDNLLLLARMDADQAAFRMEEILLSELVAVSWKPFASRAAERRVAWDNQVSSDLALTSDRQSLSVVFSDLFSNAVEYADRGGRVWTQARRVDGSIDIMVANTGCRLSPDQVGRVFDRFWRADPARSDAGIHCGLGLSLVHRIVCALGGSIDASVKDGAFILHFSLPACGPSRPQDGLAGT
jgi:two-component system heavy metal sensor histidine kinase CusS